MRRPAHRYLHLEPAIPDVVIGPVTAGILVAIVTGAIFYAGFYIGGDIRYRQGHADGVEAYTAAIETAIQEGQELVMKRGKGQVRYRMMSVYEDRQYRSKEGGMGTCEFTKHYGNCSPACVTWNVRCISMPAHRWTVRDYIREAFIAAAIIMFLSYLGLSH